MKEYKFRNATICVYGSISKERLRRATINLFKQSRNCIKVERRLGKINGNTDTFGNIEKEQILDR